MNRPRSTALLIFTMMAVTGVAGRAALIELELYNSNPLIDLNGAPLLGSTNSGDLVQVILTGADNAIDPPDPFGNPTGDDTLLLISRVGQGVPGNPDQGFLDVYPIAYLRFRRVINGDPSATSNRLSLLTNV